MTHGGIRSGAGRPQGSKSKKTLEQEALGQYIFDEVKKNQGEIVGALISEAKEGNTAAIKELFERTLGKVKNEHEIEATGDFSITEILQSLNRDRRAKENQV